jgi:O-antigen/teichoic acid export membrane protein
LRGWVIKKFTFNTFNLISNLVGQVKTKIGNLKSSQFLRQAFLLLLLNTISKAVGLVGSAYASRCLGPSNLGTSALVQATVQQISLVCDGGFTIVAVRKIAADKGSCPSITSNIVSLRLIVATVASLLWLVTCLTTTQREQEFVWLMGVPILIFSASNIGFAFQGLEKLPVQNAIGVGGTLLSAAAYLAFFKPGMFLGADLIVIAAVNAVVIMASWYIYSKIFSSLPVTKINWITLLNLMKESWHYWLLTVVVYFYSSFQIPLISYLLGVREAGIYRSAFLMGSSVELLFNSVNSLLLPRFTVWREMGVSVLWKRQSRLLVIFVLISLPPITIIILASPWIYHTFLGQDFMEGVQVFQILVLGRLVVFWGQIYTFGLSATHQDLQFFIVSVSSAVCSVLLNVLLVPKYGLVAAASVSLTSEMLVGALSYLFLRQYIMKNRSNNAGVGV